MKTRGQCYYFCYDTHSFNNPSVHILTAGIHVLAFQGGICPLIKQILSCCLSSLTQLALDVVPHYNQIGEIHNMAVW